MRDEFDDLYDEITLAALDRATTPRRPVPERVASGWRAGVGATALMTAAALGLQEVLDPKAHDPIIEELDVGTLTPRGDAPVVYFHVPGNPRASRAIVRPWLF